MIVIKSRIGLLVVSSLLLLVLSVNLSFALWGQSAEVRFLLTISRPDHEPGYDDYDTIPEGIQLIRDVIYNRILADMESFQQQLEQRIIEINNLPFGGITLSELQQECNTYRNVDIKGFGDTINKFGEAINKLADFYRNASQEEKDEVPDFWDHHKALWKLHNNLWKERQKLYDTVNEVWKAGMAKIDFNK